MKHILLLMDAPGAPLFAPRIRHLLSNLQKKDWQWIVVSERMPNTDFEFSNCRHLQFPYYSDKPGLRNKLRWLADKLFGLKEWMFYRFITNHVHPEEVDCIFCSSFHTFPLPTASRLARRWHLPFIADLRDIAEQWGETPYMQHPIHTPFGKLNRCLTTRYTALSIRQRNMALKQACSITTVSPWHKQVLEETFHSVHLIYNGYDEQTFRPKDVKSDTFNITYTGKIYDFNLRDPHLLFQALGELKKDGLLPDKLRLSFYCERDIQEQLLALAEQYDITRILHIHDFVSNDEIIHILHRTSISVILTNQATPHGSHGIMTTKFFEALGVEKPVLCVRSDEECLAQVIRETNAGVAATTAEEVRTFILDKYHEWQKNGFTHQPVIQEQKQRFTRRHQALQFEALLLSQINDR